MKVFARIDVPGHACVKMMEKYEMLPNDIQKALEMYTEQILSNWEEATTFFEFLEKDSKGKREFTHNE